ncbi:hypothetical protein [Weissella cibaria]|uniref:hypothetical protein n=1 Tax=Weissella cibaria TaxID=137591 RepID=UPI003D36EDF1
MATNFQMTEDQQAIKAAFDKNGWPRMLNREYIELYMQRQWGTIQNEYGDRPDWPVRKVAGIWSVPFEVWEGFLSAYYTGQIYKGMKNVQYGEAEE